MRIPTARMRSGSVVRSHIFCAFVFSSVNKNLTTKRKKEENALSYTRVYVELEFNWTTRPKRPRYFFFL